MATNILIVEDETVLAQGLLGLLKQEGYNAVWADSIESAWVKLDDFEPSLIVLDVILPEGENAGFEFAHALREVSVATPILFVTARDSIEDRVEGLDLGGDDYLVKPYSLDEFMARVRALLRREVQTKQANFKRGPLEVDLRKRKVAWQNQEVKLSEREFAVLEQFALYPDKTFLTEELLEHLFPNADGSRIVRVYIHHLRQKLGAEVITTASGGYRLGI